MREFVGNRRRAPRYSVRLAAVVSLLDERVAAPPTLAGYTRDISESGLGLVLPAVRLGERYLTGEGQTLRVTLQLPDTHVRLYGQAVRYERLEGEGADYGGYLLGLRLTDDEGDDRRKLNEYLKTIKR
jgi:hypothetical protein